MTHKATTRTDLRMNKPIAIGDVQQEEYKETDSTLQSWEHFPCSFCSEDVWSFLALMACQAVARFISLGAVLWAHVKLSVTLLVKRATQIDFLVWSHIFADQCHLGFHTPRLCSGTVTSVPSLEAVQLFVQTRSVLHPVSEPSLDRKSVV